MDKWTHRELLSTHGTLIIQKPRATYTVRVTKSSKTMQLSIAAAGVIKKTYDVEVG